MMRAMHISPEHPMLAAVVDDLATHGWSQQAHFLPADLVRALAAECRRRDAEGELNPAGVGRGATPVSYTHLTLPTILLV